MTKDDQWPTWATLRPEEIRATLPREEWGPWASNQLCIQDHRGPDGKQQAQTAEAPYFFHCRRHLEEIRQHTRTIKPWPSRDQGLCTTCGRPAKRLPLTMVDPVACAEAERTNSTVARIRTARHCQECKPGQRPYCRGQTCRQKGNKPKQVLLPGCCSTTSSGRRKHCRRCCKAIRQNQLERTNTTQGEKAGTASATARRRRRDERRREIATLSKEGHTTAEIATQIGATTRSVTGHLAALRQMTQSARAASSAKYTARLEAMKSMRATGKSHAEIAVALGVTYATIRRNLGREQQESA